MRLHAGMRGDKGLSSEYDMIMVTDTNDHRRRRDCAAQSLTDNDEGGAEWPPKLNGCPSVDKKIPGTGSVSKAGLLHANRNILLDISTSAGLGDHRRCSINRFGSRNGDGGDVCWEGAFGGGVDNT